jgi:hypothetical protein
MINSRRNDGFTHRPGPARLSRMTAA